MGPPCCLGSCPWLEASLAQGISSRNKNIENPTQQAGNQRPHQHSLLPIAPALCPAPGMAEELMVTHHLNE